jgi:galactokinase
MEVAELRKAFFDLYGDRTSDPVIFFSPGRVNLIGEHTDYNNGFVFPCALNYGTYLAARENGENKLRLRTKNFNFSAETDTGKIVRNPDGEWINYPLGVIEGFSNRGIKIPGLDLLFWGDIPNGAGLSSSASIEMVTAVTINHITSAALSMLDMVNICKDAENNFVGMNCGIMDMFAVGFGEKDRAIFLNCGNLKYDTVPLDLKDHRLVIINTNKRRGLTDSKYNERRSECDEAVRLLQKRIDINSLSDIGPGQIDLLDSAIADNTIRKRARHVVTENSRVLEAVRALFNSDLKEFGRLMNLSHDSLKEDYEVTGIELDTLVYEARKLEGVTGARMTGAGFGGCTVNLVHESAVENFIPALGESYRRITGLEPEFYMPTIEAGAHRIY